MAKMTHGPLTLIAGEALAVNRRVKLSSGEAVYAGLGEAHIGVTMAAAASGAPVSVWPSNAEGTVIVTAASSFALGATLYGAASGMVDDAASGSPQYIALEAATALNDEVEALPVPITASAVGAGSTTLVDAGAFTAETEVESALQEIYQHLVSAQKFIGIPLVQWREVGTNDIQNLAAHGGILAKDSTPILEYTNGDTDSALRLRWAADDVNAIVTQVPLPPDLNAGADLVLHIRAAMAGATNTPVISADSFFNEGDTKVEDDSAAITGATVAEYTITIAAADVPAGAQSLSIELTPGAHAADALYVYATWLEYTASILTA